MNFEYISKEQAKYISKKLKVSPNALFSFQNIDDYILDHNIDRVETALHDYIKKLVETDKKFAKKIGIHEDDDIEIIKDTYLYDDSYWIYTLTKKRKNKHEYVDDIIMVNFYDWKDKLIEKKLLNIDDLENYNQENNNEYLVEQIQEPYSEEDFNNITPIPVIEEMKYNDDGLRLDKKYSSEDIKYDHHEEENIDISKTDNIDEYHDIEPIVQDNNLEVNNIQEHVLETHNEKPMDFNMENHNNYQINNNEVNNKMNKDENNSIKMDNDLLEAYGDSSLLDEQNNNYMNSLSPFLDKVHYTKTRKLDDLESYKVYVNNDKKFKKYDDVDFRNESNNLKTPKNTSDIEIEDIEQIGNNGYIPYPYGPLKRPPVPYDLWRLIKDKKNLE